MSSALDKLTNVSAWTLLRDMLDVSSDVLDKREGSVLYDAIASVAIANADLLTGLIPQLYNAFQILKATGEDLEAWASNFGISRAGARYTFYRVTVEGDSKELSIGEYMRSHNSQGRWTLYADNPFVVKSEFPGRYQETVGGVLEPEIHHPNVTSVRFGELWEDGRDEETDDELRQRVINAQKTGFGGSIIEYVNLILSDYVNAGGAQFYGVQIYPLHSCCGEVYIIPYHASLSAGKSGRLITGKEADDLRDWLGAGSESGYGAGRIPIGHHVEVGIGDMRLMKFSYKIQFTGDREIDDALKADLLETTREYLQVIGTEGMYTNASSGRYFNGSYSYIYSPSDLLARIVAMLDAKHPEVANISVGYYDDDKKRYIYDTAWGRTYVSTRDDRYMLGLDAEACEWLVIAP